MTKELDLFSIRSEDKIPGKGKVLISEPFLQDTFFNRSIVLLTEHNDDGTIGFILNKGLDVRIDETLDGFENFQEVLSMGGPVQPDTLHFIHTMGDIIPGSMQVTPELWWGGDIEVIKELIQTRQLVRGQIRFFLGYAGWGKGQLSEELKENSWVIADVASEYIMEDGDHDTWKRIVGSLNNKYRIWADFPVSPEMN